MCVVHLVFRLLEIGQLAFSSTIPRNLSSRWIDCLHPYWFLAIIDFHFPACPFRCKFSSQKRVQMTSQSHSFVFQFDPAWFKQSKIFYADVRRHVRFGFQSQLRSGNRFLLTVLWTTVSSHNPGSDISNSTLVCSWLNCTFSTYQPVLAEFFE